MKSIIYLFIVLFSLSISCYDARNACHENSHIGTGFCELYAILQNSHKNNPNYSQESIKNGESLLLSCFIEKQRERKNCDKKSEYYPLPSNFNRPGGK